jgi:hypothetical protein
LASDAGKRIASAFSAWSTFPLPASTTIAAYLGSVFAESA